MANRIKELRLLAGMTLEHLAEAVGTSQQQISRLERAERRLSQVWLDRIAPALGVPPAALLPNEGQMPAPTDGEFITDAEELALVYAWRDMTPDQRSMLLRLSRPPVVQIDNAA